ncbi:hypothetical protein [Micromonospora chokoriensis]|uniref:hypothetical protein n=1 Tax=Micromonospora chokoriensis TaxID=356851 RepID=UPI0012FD7A79|nr:hypothetical protein [Micromonospora chokoriensis]
MAATRQRDDITFLPITDRPVLHDAPAWRIGGENALVGAFVQVVTKALQTT